MFNNKEIGKYFTLLMLYVAQSLPKSFFLALIPILLREQNFSLMYIGLLMSLTRLPWILKFFWAPLVDSSVKSIQDIRRWVFILGVLFSVIVLVMQFIVPEQNMLILVVVTFALLMVTAVQDIAIDIYAIFSLSDKEKSMGNSMQTAGQFLGVIVGSGILLKAYGSYGWNPIIYLLGIFVLISLFPFLTHSQQISVKIRKMKPKVRFVEIFKFADNRLRTIQVLVLISFCAAQVIMTGNMKPMLIDLDYTKSEIGQIMGIEGATIAAIASFLGGFLMKKWSSRKSMKLFSVLGLLCALQYLCHSYYFSDLMTKNSYFINSIVWFVWFSYGLSSVAIYTQAMKLVRKGKEGTDFTVQIAIMHLSSIILVPLSGKIGDIFLSQGRSAYFGIGIFAVLLAIIGLVFILLYQKEEQKSLIC
ncbi:MAG: MFS transporter [Bacteroidales bacterium]